MNYKLNRTFSGETAPKSTWLTFCIVGAFKDSIFQFISLFLLLFIQYGTDLPLDPNYNTYFLVITIVLIAVKTIGTLFTFPLMSHLSNIIKIKWAGNFRPWIFLGSLLSMIFFVMMFFNPFSGWWFVITFLIEYYLFEAFFCFNDIGYWGFFTTMSSVEKTRAKFGAVSSVFIAIGTYAVAAITPAISGGQASFAIRLIAIVIAALFVISSLILALIMQEKPINTNYESHYTDCFKLLKKNKYELPALLILMFFFAAQFILMGNSVNLFYYIYGYGNEAIYGSPLASGGFTGVCFIFTIVYGIASTISQSLYPLINKHFSRKKILTFSIFGLTIMYLLIYFLLSNRANVYWLFLGIFILVLFQGQVNSIILMINNLTIEYNDYLFGERRDKDVMAIREVFGKFSGGIQTLCFYIFLFASGLFGLNTAIGNEEAKGILDSTYNVVGNVNQLIMNTISSSDYDPKLMIFKALVFIVPMIFMWLILIVYDRFYKLDEVEYSRIIKVIEERKTKEVKE